jgi:hypothetical protein
MPSLGTDMENIPNLAPNLDNNNNEPHMGEEALKDDDHIFMATIPCEAEFI